MKTLFILRHAKSSWDNAHLSDYERPLNERGKRDAPRVGQVLKQQGKMPDLIITSSAERALATAEAAALHSDYAHEIKPDRRLYHAPPATYLAVLRELGSGPERVMVVGHNPGIEDLIYHLTRQAEAMPTAAVVQIHLPIQQWADLDETVKGDLVWLWRPKE